MIIYPNKPWSDGQTFIHTTPDGEELIGVYDESKNAWTFYRPGESVGGGSSIVTTADVRTLNTRPAAVRSPFSLTNDPNTLVNQQEANWYLWEEIQVLQNEIIELEEEIDAIAPSLERGSWTFNASGVITGKGIFTAYDQPIAQAGNPTGMVQSIKSLWLHSIDKAGTRHGFTDVDPGQLLEIFVDGSPDYGLFEVVEVHDYTNGAGDYWIIDVNFVRTLENTTSFKANDLCRFNIFEPPTGGGTNVAVSDSAPRNPQQGQLWFNTNDTELTLYIYYDGVFVPAAPDSPKVQ